MTEEQHARLWALFDQASDLPPPQQKALLNAACPDDPTLRAELEQLLAADAQARAQPERLLRGSLVRSTHSPQTPGQVALPAHLGHYRLLRLLGEGGMGAVYEAEQDNPRRHVALKVIRSGLLAPDVLKRF